MYHNLLGHYIVLQVGENMLKSFESSVDEQIKIEFYKYSIL